MLIKIIIGILLIVMIYNLFKAMTVMLKDEPKQANMSKYIGRRVLTSVAIVLVILIAMATGLIEPNPRPY
ncbi:MULTISPECIES: DUF2909 domain-containing protein [Paraglaciecola]|uniref:DUF2909 domain-containing protein n=5 Tax=Paraglaciecola TaxID=1621534 RepID=A0A857JMX9_9ALTE|nr:MULTISPECIES: DUF2909 domain-containing protein [Paraglaciecola]AEE25124.1 hypothetical protein Glaag_4200 [Glaciecola sp. 4H-3-7+YE-5]MBN27586.1 DUF2909 domain-containing protein [Alteromonadaceae bacterium]MBJ2136695.1 DUF2909 domain-containing protein [Paraglaciecola chathamensis]MBU3017738.1 DUF2909 domain-containing protein [Paraglaciecola agarilytica]MDO6560215.1 DUF2909 domain-containing protein [Paraglaciecola chathamensis]